MKTIKLPKKKNKTTKINKIISDFKGFKHIPQIKARGKKGMITHMRDKSGNPQQDRQTIPDVFADFYEELYQSRFASTEFPHRVLEVKSQIPPISSEEVG